MIGLFKEVMVRHSDILFVLVRDILDYIDIKFDDDIKSVVSGYELLLTTLSKTPLVVNLSIDKCCKLYYTGNY